MNLPLTRTADHGLSSVQRKRKKKWSSQRTLLQYLNTHFRLSLSNLRKLPKCGVSVHCKCTNRIFVVVFMQDGRYANWNRREPLNRNRLNRLCEPEPHEPEPVSKLWTSITGVKFGRTELSIPPIEISRRDLQDGHIFSIFDSCCDFGFGVFGCF